MEAEEFRQEVRQELPLGAEEEDDPRPDDAGSEGSSVGLSRSISPPSSIGSSSGTPNESWWDTVDLNGVDSEAVAPEDDVLNIAFIELEEGDENGNGEDMQGGDGDSFGELMKSLRIRFSCMSY